MKIIYDENIINDNKTLEILERAAELCVASEGLETGKCEVSFSIVSAEEIRDLNATYRGKDSVTDVLSFPQYDDLNDIYNEEEICLGDVVINSEAVKAQAEEYGHSYERELVYLFVHSVLHLLGYDHMQEDDKCEMRAFEERVMSELGIVRA